jgi:putative transposase
MARFREIRILRKFATVRASIHNHFSLDRHLTRRFVFKQNRSAALAEWDQLAARDLCFPALWRPVRMRLTRPRIRQIPI